MKDYVENFDAEDPAPGAENVAVALALVAAIDYDTVENNSSLKQLLDGMNLLPPDWNSSIPVPGMP
jgi:hypothetical protein